VHGVSITHLLAPTRSNIPGLIRFVAVWCQKRRIGNGRALAHYAGRRPVRVKRVGNGQGDWRFSTPFRNLRACHPDDRRPTGAAGRGATTNEPPGTTAIVIKPYRLAKEPKSLNRDCGAGVPLPTGSRIGSKLRPVSGSRPKRGQAPWRQAVLLFFESQQKQDRSNTADLALRELLTSRRACSTPEGVGRANLYAFVALCPLSS